jgi:hypothetical protein
MTLRVARCKFRGFLALVERTAVSFDESVASLLQVAFAGCRHEARAIEKRNLPSAARNQTGAFRLSRAALVNAWPLDGQQFRRAVFDAAAWSTARWW